MKSYSRGLFLWVFLALVVMLAFTMMSNSVGVTERDIGFSDVVTAADQAKIKSLTVKGEEITGELDDGTHFHAVGPTKSEYFLNVLAKNNVNATF